MPAIVGIPTEIKSDEDRVAIAPSGVHQLVEQGHTVLIQRGAGSGSGISDEEFHHAGSEIVPGAAEVFARADVVAKVKEPLPEEYGQIREGQILFSYFHFAASRELTEAMLATGATCVAYETIQDDEGGLPLLLPMSEVAGRMAALQGARCLERAAGGRGAC